MSAKRNFIRKPSSSTYPPESPSSGQQWSPFPLLSKTLTVANLPPEFAPKNLYDLFSKFGKAEGAFVYAFPDAQGRRVGEVAMATFLFAQKVSLRYSSDIGA
jgi:RNA recognition motif-containing protein